MAPAKVKLEPHSKKQYEGAPTEVRNRLKSHGQRLVDNPQLGTYISPRSVPRQKILKTWENRLGQPIQNIYKLALPGYWRALYTVLTKVPTGDKIILILEVVDHKEYERLLGYN